MDQRYADAEGFRKAMSVFATGVAIAVVQDPGAGPVGVTINSPISVSLGPFLVLFCIRQRQKIQRHIADCLVNPFILFLLQFEHIGNPFAFFLPHLLFRLVAYCFMPLRSGR
jgi:hypothetical protein